MALIDYIIVVIYLSLMILIGLYFQKKASEGIDSFFLGNRKMSWWMLGASGMASNLDVSGTMINVALIYALGAMGFFVEIRGGIVLIMAFLMIFMGKWNRRANVMTLAEWMEFRFGNGNQGRLARLISAIAVLVTTIWIITYFAVGAGKFIGEFLGFPEWLGLSSEFWAAAVMILLATTYTVASGLHGVVWTDIFQGVLIFFTIILVCFIAFTQFNLPEVFAISVPTKTGGFLEIEMLKEQWSNPIPVWQLNFPEESQYSIFNLFGIAILFYIIRTTIDGCAGTSGYMMQRFYASKSDREAGLLSLFWTFLLSFRWPFIAAIAIMGIVFGAQQGQAIQDPEKVLPIVINELVPIGLKGLLVAGLMAAAMSTFDSVVNGGASYWVKDIYQSFINPQASEKQLVRQSRWASLIIVITGLLFTLDIRNINEIWSWLTMGIGAGLTIPLLIRWYWWRLNGYGFAAGMAAGMISAFIQKIFFPGIEEYISFSFIACTSFLATIVTTLLTKSTDIKTLTSFYKITRPFGFWNKIKNQFENKEELESIKKENKNDIYSIFLAVPWQLILFLTMMMLVIKRWDYLIIFSILLIMLSILLYFNWYRKLSTVPKINN